MTILQVLFWSLIAIGLGVIIRKIFIGEPLPGMSELIEAGYDKPVRSDGSFDREKFYRMRDEFISNKKDLTFLAFTVDKEELERCATEVVSMPEVIPETHCHNGYMPEIELTEEKTPDEKFAARLTRMNENFKDLRKNLRLNGSLTWSEAIYGVAVSREGPLTKEQLNYIVDTHSLHQDFLEDLYRR